MTRARVAGRLIARRLRLSVGQRLFVGLLPSLLAVALVLGLAYWGQYAHTAPGLVVVGAAVLAVASLVATWLNARSLATRIARLAARGATSTTDELDRIELVVDSLGSALTAAETARASTDEAAAARLSEQATLLSSTVRLALAQLDDVRLPLHILLDAKFGELNENQEELLRDARAAADTVDEALRRLGQVADADRGALPVQRELVQVNDVVRAVLPLARAAAARRGARVDAALEPGLPRVSADRVRLAEALTLLLQAAAESVGPDHPVVVSTSRDQRQVAVRLVPLADGAFQPQDGADGAASDRPSTAHDLALATRLVDAQGGSLVRQSDGLTIRLG